jgi:hypothetical protein
MSMLVSTAMCISMLHNDEQEHNMKMNMNMKIDMGVDKNTDMDKNADVWTCLVKKFLQEFICQTSVDDLIRYLTYIMSASAFLV